MVVLFLVFKGISILFSIVAISLWQKSTQHCKAIFLQLKERKRNSVKQCSQNSQPAVQLQTPTPGVYCVSPLHSIPDPGISSTTWHAMNHRRTGCEGTHSNRGSKKGTLDCFCGEFSQNQLFETHGSTLSKQRPSLCQPIHTAIMKYYRLHSLETREIYSSQFWKMQVQDKGAGRVGSWWEPCAAGQPASFSPHPHRVGGVWEPRGIYGIRALIPPVRAPPLSPSTSQSLRLLTPSQVCVWGFQHENAGERRGSSTQTTSRSPAL